MSLDKIGDWALARRVLSPGAGRRVGRALRTSVRREAERLRAEIVVGFRKQAPGGAPFKRLSKLTLAARRLAGFRGRKALVRRGDLRNSIAVVTKGDVAFVGVPRSAGRDKLRLAEVHEYGTQPTIIPITPRMRRFLGALFGKARRARLRRNRRGNGSGVVVVQIPARPFLRPSFEAWRKGLDRRFIASIRKELGWK